MIIKIDKKEIDLYKEACIFHGLSFQEYTIETNDLMVTCEIMIDDIKPLEPSQSLCVFLGRQVQMNWQKLMEQEVKFNSSQK